MSVEQWGVIALFILLPLLEGVARLRRTRVSDDRPSSDRVAQAPQAAPRVAPLANRHVSDGVMGTAETSAIPPPPSLPPPLPQPASDAAVALGPIRATQTRVSSRGSGSLRLRGAFRGLCVVTHWCNGSGLSATCAAPLSWPRSWVHPWRTRTNKCRNGSWCGTRIRQVVTCRSSQRSHSLD